MTAALTHPLSPAGRVDPYATLAAFRRVQPAFRDPGSGMVLLTSYELVHAALRAPQFSAAAGQQQRLRDDDLPVSMLTTDAALHDRLRGPATAPFSARSIAAAGNDWALLAERAVRALPAGPVDLVPELATPFATAVLSHLLGLPRTDHAELGRLARAASANLDPTLRGPAAEAARHASAALSAFLAASSRRRRADTGGDLAGLDAHADLTENERLGIFTLVVVGGWEPLAVAVASTVHLLLDRADRSEVAADASTAVAAVDEALRVESPIPFTARVCVADWTSPSGVRVPAGTRVLAMLGAANRDPDVFPDPDEFDPSRAPNPHLALGGGPHFCLGAPLIRQSVAALVVELFRAHPTVHRPAGPRPAYGATLLPRALATLPVVL